MPAELMGGAKKLVKRLLTPERPAPRKKEHLWSIGIYSGPSPLALVPAAQNPALTAESVTDVRARFVADPFMLRAAGRWYMFFEVMNRANWNGEIGLATSDDGLRWTYRQIVLAEPFHLSYPCVFEWQGQFYMVPESWHAGALRLYRAEDFPTRWAYVSELLTGPYFADATPFRFADRWWMFAETNPDLKHDTLRLFYAEELTGAWREHVRSPVVAADSHIARPAGRVLVEAGRLIRFAQDCEPIYGLSVRAFEITELSLDTYAERMLEPAPLLAASGTGWNRSGMHHVDAHQLEDGNWLACVDGWEQVEV
jgi:hypothetical protein